MASGSVLWERLLRLAVDEGASEHEARNAAITLCRLIDKAGGLKAMNQAEPDTAELRSLRSHLSLVSTQLVVERGRRIELESKVAKLETQLKEAHAKSTTPPLYKAAIPKIFTRYSTRCLVCSRPIVVGERCHWIIRKGVVCMQCDPYGEANAAPEPAKGPNVEER